MMICLSSFANFFLPLGFIAFALAGTALIMALSEKRRFFEVVSFLSMTFGILTVLSEHCAVGQWVAYSDWGALLDVVPTMSKALPASALVGIVINAIALGIHLKKAPKE